MSALSPAVRDRDAAWVGWAGDTGGRLDPFRDDRLYLLPVRLSAIDVEEYYEGFSNATLWPLFHDLVVQPAFRASWWEAYQRVNARFAAAVATLAGPAATVWVHDYHLMLVPQMLRSHRPDLRIGWFDHVPFPPVELYAQLPWRRDVLEGLLGADLLGFQTVLDAENFRRACGQLLELSTSHGVVAVPGSGDACPARSVRIQAVPISVDFSELDAVARTAPVIAAADAFRRSVGDPRVLVLGCDRLDYTKGIRHRLAAYEELLRDGAIGPPDVTFVQVALGSREGIPAYRTLREEVERTVRRINDAYAVHGCAAVHLWQRVVPQTERVAMFRAADVMLVTPRRDGMNLVAKEYVSCQPHLDGALVLSEFAGASHEMPEAYACNPHDTVATAHAIRRAINAPRAERVRRMSALRARVAQHDVHRWAREYLEALAGACGAAP